MPIVRKRYVTRNGFSLIEIIFALVIVSTVLAVAIPRLQTGMEIHLRAGTRKLASAIRYSYNEAVVTGRYYRIVFSMDPEGRDSYWIEVSDKPVTIRTPDEVEDFERRLKYLNDKDRQEALDREPHYQKLDGSLSKPITFPSGVHFKDAFVQHQTDRITVGEAYLNFFPNGSTEQAVINLEDKDGNIFGIEVSPLAGKVRVQAEYLDYARL